MTSQSVFATASPYVQRLVAWQALGLLCGALVLGVLDALAPELAPEYRMLQLLAGTIGGVAFGLFFVPVTFPLMWFWTRLVRGYPRFESRPFVLMLLGIAALAGVAAVLAAVAVAGNWSILAWAPGNLGNPSESGLWGRACSLYLPLLAGFVVPRLLVKSLRPGVFTPSAGDAG